MEDKSDLNTARKESRKFRTLLRGILTGRRRVDELLEFPLFKRRLMALCRLLTKNEWDAKDLYNDVCLKLWRSVRSFQPDFKQPYGKFFAWLRTVTRRTFFDKIRGPRPEFTDDGLEGVELVDAGSDANDQLVLNERKRRLREAIAKLPRKKRLAVTLYVYYGYSTRETADILQHNGMSCTHASVAKWVRDTLRAAFPEAPMIKPLPKDQSIPSTEPPRKPNAPAGRRAKSATEANEGLEKVKVTRKAAKG